MRESDIKVLSSLGLGRPESIIYLDLVKTGTSTVIDISKRVDIHRTNVYDSVRKLKEMGLIIEILEGSTKKYSPIEPKKLRLYLKQKETELDDLIKDLEKIPQNKSLGEPVSVLEGISIKAELLNLLDLKKPIYISAPSEFDFPDKKFMEEFKEKRIKNKVLTKIIFSGKSSEAAAIGKNPYIQIKYSDNKTASKVVTLLVEDTIYYLLLNENPILIKIQNKDICAENISHFECIWDKL